MIGGNDPSIMKKVVTDGPMKEMLRGLINHADYEKLGEHELAVRSVHLVQRLDESDCLCALF